MKEPQEMPQNVNLICWNIVFDAAESELQRVLGTSVKVRRDGYHLIVRRGPTDYHLWMHQTDQTPGHRVFEFSSAPFPHLAGVLGHSGGQIAAESFGHSLGKVREETVNEPRQVAACVEQFARRHGFR